MNLKQYYKKKIKKFRHFCIKKKCSFALSISDKLIMYMNRLKKEASKYPDLYKPINKIDSKAKKWVKFNPWFGRDYYLTEKAIDIHHILIRSGIKSTTTRYYHEIDKRMYFYFKDHLKKYYSMEN